MLPGARAARRRRAVVFHDEIDNYVPPSTRQGQLFRLLHAIEKAKPGARTDFRKPFIHFQNFLHRRGLVVVLSDFYAEPATVVQTFEPLRLHGNDVVLFHVLDPQELAPRFREQVLLVDMRTKTSLEVSPSTRATSTRAHPRASAELRDGRAPRVSTIS